MIPIIGPLLEVMTLATVPILISVVDTEKFEGVTGNFHLSAVRDKLGRSSPETYVVFECVDKLLGELHRVNVDDISVHANEDQATSGTVVDGWCITV